MPIADPRNRSDFGNKTKLMLHCDLRVRWKIASDLRFRAVISEPNTHSFCRNSGDLAPSTRKSLAIAIVRGSVTGVTEKVFMCSGTKVCTDKFCASGTRIWARILGNEFWAPEFWTRIPGSDFLTLFFPAKEPPLKNSPSRNSPPKIHLPKFNPEFGPKNSHCTSAGPFD